MLNVDDKIGFTSHIPSKCGDELNFRIPPDPGIVFNLEIPNAKNIQDLQSRTDRLKENRVEKDINFQNWNIRKTSVKPSKIPIFLKALRHLYSETLILI